MNSTYCTYPEPRTVRLERLLPGPIDRVWSYLTDSQMRATWFAGGPMELHVGGKAELLFRHENLSSEPIPEEYKPHCGEGSPPSIGHITRCAAPHLLAYTWWEDQGDQSEITFELQERGDDVLLTLTHRRLEDRKEMLNVSPGWHIHLDLLEANLRGTPRRPFWGTLATLKEEYEKRVPADA
jgi:uncharacterized protein YndB with AHSA1/START domain